jgi:inner membrane protein involved in colicin E2 resistance
VLPLLPSSLQDYGPVKLLLVPLAIVAFILFLLVLGAIGFAVAFLVLSVFGRAWRLISGGGSARR